VSVTNEQGDDGYVDRRWSVPKPLWDQLLELAADTGINYAELVNICLEDGLKLRMRLPVERARPKPPPPPWLVVYVEQGGKVLGRLNMRQVPAEGEVLTIDGASFVVQERAWTVKDGDAAAYLRVEGLVAE
jgi:hypothetical protein